MRDPHAAPQGTAPANFAFKPSAHRRAPADTISRPCSEARACGPLKTVDNSDAPVYVIAADPHIIRPMAQRSHHSPAPRLDADKAAALKLTPVSRETEQRLDRYVALLQQWQAKTNLV